MNQRKIINKYKQDTKKRSVRDHKNLKSALKLLAENIYSSDDHFVYELIQNAQDNKYSDGIIPTLEFILLSDDPTNSPESEGCLCIYNNERGFTEEDIHGICSIGQSTKTDKKTSGSIGEKGIGFKSVFKISSYPHIFSNGFSIRLNDESYIDPDWVEELPKEVKVETSNTCILLPLKKGMYDYVCESLLNYESNTSIFLDKLKKIEISIPSIKHSSSVDL